MAEESKIMGPNSLQLDAASRCVTVDGRSTTLQEKNWQVLSLILERAPGTVGRTEIIDTVWQGNYLTGDKGLNHALWAIRAALADDARSPRFIRTVPRLGYKWIHETSPQTSTSISAPARNFFSRAAGFASLVLVVTAGAGISRSSPDIDVDSQAASPERVATRAYRVNRDIHVEFAGGCLGILKNSKNADIGKPVLSADGGQVAVAIHEDNSCRLMTIDVTNGEREDFGACPSEVI